MSQALVEEPRARIAPPFFALAIFTSAALIFLVEPMIAKLVLPKLGGSPAVWNTSMVFFQAALLVGYGYAHLLQRLKSLHMQIRVHLVLAVLAALALPLRVTGVFGDPPTGLPIPWLLGVLAVSIGAPFAVLSATAPLLQAWYARVRQGEPDAENPYVLYAASNLGSFVALLAYPTLVEPLLRLSTQRVLWTGGYALFVAMVVTLGVLSWRADGEDAAPPLPTSPAVSWRERIIWMLLAAVPSSLMLGLTLHLTIDIASAPFLWVIPLALYLLTFVLAFQNKPLIPMSVLLVIQGVLLAIAVPVVPFTTDPWPILFALNIALFFVTALMCHQTLAARRPPPDRLTEFYLWLSIGGVLGGSFNALVAPLIFNVIREYPIVLVLSALARPWGKGRPGLFEIAGFATAIVFSVLAYGFFSAALAHPEMIDAFKLNVSGFEDSWVNAEHAARLALFMASLSLLFARNRAIWFAIGLAALLVAADKVDGRYDWVRSERSFFGVLRVSHYFDPNMKSDMRVLMNGTTLHGAQAVGTKYSCHPMTYYAQNTPIGQVMESVEARKPAVSVGVVGLGTGAVAAYKRSTDAFTYFEIDPKVLHFSTANPRQLFTYTTECARGPVKIVMGDARLSLAKQPSDQFDVLVVDAFSSDSVPTHLLTEEALKTYLRVIKPDGVVILHLSNRNLEITSSAEATAKAIGAPALHQTYDARSDVPELWEESEDALMFTRNWGALAPYALNTSWRRPAPTNTRPWTDDYTNLIGALWRHIRHEEPKELPD